MTDFAAAVAAIKEGQLVGVPTDTVYGIAADPFRPDALERLYELKGRADTKPIAILVTTAEQGAELAAFNDRAHDLAGKHWPGGLTLVLAKLDTTPEWMGDPAARTVGLRCPDHEVTQALLEATGPLAATSANLAGQPSAVTADEARDIFGDAVSLYLEGEGAGGRPSTVVDLTRPGPHVLRPGPVEA
ncbi:MAG: threonylcarbamoyl-AMP synthase [Acidimicrobiia bacterium]|nr:threonylcarbamoyl-AMP synthase [Acidimicrobiia bacterium]NNC74621.1 threonylcarbamoyl-AMP synthase [Acidimicrobiia bacterium]